jgi:AraC family transcriptional regulator
LTLDWRELGNTIVSDNLYRPLTHLPAHSHERAYVAFVLKGGFRELCDRESIECAVGTVLFHPEEEVHADSFTPAGGRIFSVELGRDWNEDLVPRLGARQVLRGGHVFQLGLGLRLRLMQEDGLADLHAEEFSRVLGAEIARLRQVPAREARSAWIQRAKDFLRAHYAEPLTLSGIARHAEVHPVHLARQFRRVQGCTVGDFIRALRLQRATELLLDTEEPIAQIATACGFSDQAHLTRLLKAALGVPPSKLRARLGTS